MLGNLVIYIFLFASRQTVLARYIIELGLLSFGPDASDEADPEHQNHLSEVLLTQATTDSQRTSEQEQERAEQELDEEDERWLRA